MVSGLKKEPKKKEKLVFAKNKNQALLAYVILSLFLANSVYMVVKYFMDQAPPPPSSSTSQPQTMDPKNPNMDGPTGATDPTKTKGSATDETATQPTPTPAPTPITPPSSGINPIIPILILLLIAGGIFGGKKFLDSQKFSNGEDDKSSSNSRIKKGAKDNKKFSFAANKKQATIALVVIGALALNTIYMIGKYIYDQNPPAQTVSKEANSLAEQQQQNLQNMDDPSMQMNNANPTTSGDVNADANDIYKQTVNLQGGNPPNQAANGESDVEIMSKTPIRKNGKMTLITVADSGRSNPFLPAAENILPSSLPKLNLLAPPESVATDSDAGKVMTTTISGILYDKYSPSAIINIEGTDYLVKRGDLINQYKILSIGKTEVIVQLGRNIYKAGVGQLLTLTDINFNTIANLNKKFGGNNVSINVRKKGY